ncbi:delta-like protein 4 [Haliotis cracherodii]|uniref:delta-like protein 4 n=1 Tax=Haliotis cracherodii TaxID=6455 RepID=UPI0039EB6BF2
MGGYIISTVVIFAVAVTQVSCGGGNPGDYCTLGHGCVNGGTCDPTANGGLGRCACPTGYSGRRCQTACNSNTDCQNQGTCSSGLECQCPSGYSGGKCETPSAASPVTSQYPSLIVISVFVGHLTKM